MKAIFVCDNNPVYSEFWEHQAKYMWKRYALPSLLYYLTDSDTHNLYTSEFAEVRVIPLTTSTPRIIQALHAKWYFPSHENTSEKMFICDIDCFVLSKEFIERVKSEQLVFHMSYYERNVPGYYVAGTPSQLKEFFRLEDYPDFESFCKDMFTKRLREIESVNINENDYSIFSRNATPDWKFFGSEEIYAGDCYKLYTKPTSTMNAPNQYSNRICRSENSRFDETKLRQGGYIDYHCPRPYEKYKLTIRNILDKSFG